MEGLLISNQASFTLSLTNPPPPRISFKPPQSVFLPAVRLSGNPVCLKTRARGRLTVVTRAGPNTSSYVLAFLLPLSLILITVFTSVRVADKLDEQFLEEIQSNQAFSEDDEENNADLPLEEQPTRSRTRDRPKREV